MLLGAFATSGVLHQIADYALLRNWTGRSFAFFLLQAVAILLEDMAIEAAKEAGFRDSGRVSYVWKVVGWLWVIFWFSLTMPMMIDRQLRGGIFGFGGDLSIITGLRTGQWVVSYN